jgi:hypothetical protein
MTPDPMTAACLILRIMSPLLWEKQAADFSG